MERHARRDIAHGKGVKHHNLIVAAYFVRFNSCRPHMALSIFWPITPAMASSLAEEVKSNRVMLDMT